MLFWLNIFHEYMQQRNRNKNSHLNDAVLECTIEDIEANVHQTRSAVEKTFYEQRDALIDGHKEFVALSLYCCSLRAHFSCPIL